jgi:hypothetical protein
MPPAPNESPRSGCPQCGDPAAPRPHLRYGKLAWVRCGACGGGWMEPYDSELNRADDPDIEDTYQDYESAAAVFDAIAREKADWILPFLDPELTYLEIGPGVGAVARSLRARRPGLPVVLFEPNPRFLARLRADGFEVESGDPQSAIPALLARLRGEGRHTLCLMDNVLEHVPWPVEALRALHAGCLPGSRVLIEVPNEAGLAWRARVQDVLRGERKPPTFPGHVNLFTRSTLERSLRRAGATDVDVRPTPIRRPEHVSYLTHVTALNWKIRLALAGLNALPVDRMLGVEYWLRASASVGSGNR